MKLFLLFFLIIFHLCQSVRNEDTSICGTVVSHRNESIRSLQDTNLVLIIKQDTNHDQVHHLRLNVNQSSFPFNFIMRNITEIKSSGVHLLSLLIFGKPHLLLWEGVLFRQHLTINQLNPITFIVQDVSNLPKCLSEGYPCIDTNGMFNQVMSMCCSDTKCQYSDKHELKKPTCGGRPSVVIDVFLSYILPTGMKVKHGPLDYNFLKNSQIIYQAISVPGTIITVTSGTIDRDSRNMNDTFHSSSGTEYVLLIHLSITSSASCKVCQTQTLYSIEHKQMPFNIPLQDDQSSIIMAQTSTVHVTGISGEKSTTEVLSDTTTTTTTTMITTTTATTAMITTTTATAILSTTTATNIPCSLTCSSQERCVQNVCVGVGKLSCTLTWSRAVDGDIVVTTPNNKTIYYRNKGPSKRTDQGQLDIDDWNGTGPENVFWSSSNSKSVPPTGVYYVCFFMNSGSVYVTVEDPITATLKVMRLMNTTLTFTRNFTSPQWNVKQCKSTSTNLLGSFIYP